MYPVRRNIHQLADFVCAEARHRDDGVGALYRFPQTRIEMLQVSRLGEFRVAGEAHVVNCHDGFASAQRREDKIRKMVKVGPSRKEVKRREVDGLPGKLSDPAGAPA